MSNRKLVLCVFWLLIPYVCQACVETGGPPVRSGGSSSDSGSAQSQRAFGAVTTGTGSGARVALVVGIGAYADVPLRNPVNDAADMAQTLERCGFSVAKKTNVALPEIEAAVRQFAADLRNTKGVGLFFFAGHGLQVDGVNYLVPIGAEIKDRFEVKHKCLTAQYVMDAMEEAGNPMNIIILDACRNNPFRGFRTPGGGLAKMDAPRGAILAFATAPGSVAEDGSGRNGLYTSKLLQHIATPGQPLEQMFKRVRADVEVATGGSQRPWETTSLTGEFAFVPGSSAAVAASAPASSAPSTPTSSPPSIQMAGGPDVDELARQRKREQEEWSAWQKRMDAEYAKLDRHDRENVLTAKDKEEMWGAFLTNFAGDNKYSTNDEVLRAKAQQRQSYWRGKREEAEEKARVEAERQKPSLPSAGTPTSTPPASDSTFTNTIGQKFVLIKPGTFVMGSPQSESGRDSDETQHEVTISRPFYLQTTEVTQGQWKAVMGNNPSRFLSCGDDCPVEQISWNDVREFISRLNAKEGGGKYRLPTEAEWEYGARAGSRTAYSFGDSASELGDYAWYDGNSGNTTHAVGRKRANAWGLYDMAGNVWEWCQDWFGGYPSGSVTGPQGASNGSRRVFRGGSWYLFARFCRSAYRGGFEPGISDVLVGFRLARTP